MKYGDKIECVDSEPVSASLTPGRIYEVKKKPFETILLSDTVHIINDSGVLAGYLKRRFKLSKENFIKEADNTVSFVLQDGPIKEFGVNGCQIDDALQFFRDKLQSFQGAVPCHENTQAILNLDIALMWLKKRKDDREKRGVEGTRSL